MGKNKIAAQPRQKLTFRQKTKKWRQENVDYANNFSLYYSTNVRKSLKNKIINLNLYNGILDMSDLNDIVNPNHIDASFIPQNIVHHPILAPKIDLLVGEEMKRNFEYKAVVTNQKALSTKGEEKKNEILQRVSEMLQQNYEEEELEQELDKLGQYMNYEWQDLRERMVNQILNHYSQEQRFGLIFNECFKSALIQGEEIVQIEIVHDEPVLTKLNPLKVRTVNTSNSSKIEDSDLIIIEDHWSPGKIVDYFHDELKPKDIDYLEDYNNQSGGGNPEDHYKNERGLLGKAFDGQGNHFMDSLFQIAEVNGHYFNSDLTDEDGNIRVLRVYWKSKKKIQKIKYYDEFGDVEYKVRSEEYIPNTHMGEESTSLWVNEMWEGTLIGKDIYVNMRPMREQYNRLSNPSYCHAGIIGQVFNTDQGKAVSLIDRMKNYQYMYDVMWDRLNKAISTNYGKVMELDLAKVPEGWEIEKWLHFVVTNKISVVDSFKEGNKGSSTGKLAGGMNTQGGRSIDMETGNYIQQHVNMLEFIKQEMGEIAGITKQREGQISNRETVGGVERSVNQSANVTEYWFNIHEDFKIRVLEAFVEAAKVALKNNKKKMQYVLDDLSISLLEVDGDEIAEADFGIVCTNSSKAMELEQTIKQLAQTFVQTTGRITPIIDIYTSDSIADMRKKIENTERELQEQEAEAQQSQQEAQQELAQMEAQDKEAERQLKDMISQRQEDTKRYVADLAHSNDGIQDPSVDAKLEIDREKVANDLMTKMRALEDDMKKHSEEMKRKDKEIAVSRMQAKKK